MTPADTPDQPDLPDEEVAVRAFEDALWTALRAEHAAYAARAATAPDGADDPDDDVDLDVPVVEPVGEPARPTGLRRVLAAAAVVVVVGAAALLAVRIGADGDGDPGPVATDPTTTEPPTTEPPTTDPATMEAEVAAALTELAATHVVAVEERRGGLLVGQTWSDQRSGALRIVGYRSDGERPLTEVGLAEPLDPDGGLLVDPVFRTVDHCLRQHALWTGPTMSGVDDLSGLARDIEEGRVVIDGTEVVDDRELVVFRPVRGPSVDLETGETSLPDPPIVEDHQATYLDPVTFVPVLFRVVATADRPEEERTYRLLPRQPEMLELLLATPPAGYAEVATPATDEERGAALCF